MSYGFFLRKDYILTLPYKSKLLEMIPLVCMNKSEIVPHMLPSVIEIIPTYNYINQMGTKNVYIPLFNIKKESTGEIMLIFNPNMKMKDVENNETLESNTLGLYMEIFKNVKMMYLCQDLSGYYIGIDTDPGICKFRIIDGGLPNGVYMCKPNESIDRNYLDKRDVNNKFNESKIFLEKVGKNKGYKI